jgi:hypothetical protein
VVVIVVVVKVVDEVDPAVHRLRQRFRQLQKASWSMSGPSSKAAGGVRLVANQVR